MIVPRTFRNLVVLATMRRVRRPGTVTPMGVTRSRTGPFLRSTALAVLLAGVGAAPALGTRGVSLDLGAIAVSRVLVPGETVRLPEMGVHNPGTETAHLEMSVRGISDDGIADPSPDWIHFSPTQFDLAPGQSRVVRPTLEVPIGAEPGQYATLLSAAAGQGGEGVTVGVAAAARLTFEIAPSDDLSALIRRIGSMLDDWAPWWYLLVVAILSILVRQYLARRFSFRIERRR